MADVRALLRQQRSARRVEHPHAVYSESGKLSCAVCHEPIRPESAWAEHIRGVGHRQNARVHEMRRQKGITATNSDRALLAQSQQSHKRKHSETEDDDAEMDSDASAAGDEDESAARRKRNRSDEATSGGPTISIELAQTAPNDSDEGGPKRVASASLGRTSRETPPQLGPRRTSGTPVQGVEMQIPSRPATPNVVRDSFLGGAGESVSVSGSGSGGLPSAVSTPKAAPFAGRSPLIPQDEAPVGAPTRAETNGSTPAGPSKPAGTAKTAEEIDEDEWAAFEAEVVNTPVLQAPSAPKNARISLDGVVASAAPVSAKELESEEEQRSQRRAAEATQLEDEKEEANRALEAEFEEMEELESRVRKLKEKREALQALASKEIAKQTPAVAVEAKEDGNGNEEEEEDEDDDLEDADDWGAFRFKA